MTPRNGPHVGATRLESNNHCAPHRLKFICVIVSYKETIILFRHITFQFYVKVAQPPEPRKSQRGFTRTPLGPSSTNLLWCLTTRASHVVTWSR
jgi:hypothetical protein